MVAEFGPEVVVHLAAQASVTASLRDPDRDRAVNAEGTHRVAAAAREAGATRMISASSAAVYGEPAQLPLVESAPTVPTSPYGASKLEAEGLLAAQLAGSAVDYASFRFSNVYGPRQDAAGEGGVVAIFSDRLRRGEPPVLYGDGSQTRDFIYVGDVVAAVLAAAAFDGRLSCGARRRCPVQRVDRDARERLRAAHGGAPVRGLLSAQQVNEAAPPRATSCTARLDPARAAEVFGWHAGVSLENGVALTWRWFAARR